MKTTSNGKVRRSKSEWSELIAAYKSSGISQEAFCEREGVAKSSFSKWHQRLRSEPGPKNGFIELKAKPSCWDLELDLGRGVVLRMRSA